MIHIKCDECGKGYKLPSEAAGKKAKCKACGAIMVIPAAPDDPLGVGGDSNDPGRGDLSSLYGGGKDPVGAPASPAGEQGGFSPGPSFSNTPRRRKKKSGPPTGMLLGFAGGGVGLIIVVVLAIVLLGGNSDDDKKKDDGGGGLAIGTGTTPSGGPTIDFNTPDVDDTSDPEDEDEDETPTGINAFGGKRVITPAKSAMVSWSFPPAEDADTTTQRVDFRGLVLRVPSVWETETLEYEEMSQSLRNKIKDAEFFVFDSSSDTAQLNVKAGDDRGMSIVVTTANPDAGKWPAVFEVSSIRYEMLLSPDEVGRVEELANEGTDNQQFALGLLQGMAEELSKDQIMAFSASKPTGYYVNLNVADSVKHGSMLGGHRFIRVTGKDPKGIRSINYIGNVGGLQVVMSAHAPAEDMAVLTEFDRVFRTAVLASREEAETFAKNDSTYDNWLGDEELGVLLAGDPAPLTGLTAAKWEGGTEAPPDLTPPVFATPTGKDYAIVVPSGLEVISTTRAAVRTKPLENGTWLSMEVHKLAGLERRQASPINTAKKTILMRGYTFALPAEAELTEIDSDHYKIHRLHYPAQPGQAVRKIVYVIKDGAYLITVEGRYPAEDAEALALLDEAAKSVQPKPEDDEEDEDDEVFESDEGDDA